MVKEGLAALTSPGARAARLQGGGGRSNAQVPLRSQRHQAKLRRPEGEITPGDTDDPPGWSGPDRPARPEAPGPEDAARFAARKPGCGLISCPAAVKARPGR